MATVIISSLLKDMLVLVKVLAEILQTIQGCSWCVLWTLPFFVITSSPCARLFIHSFLQCFQGQLIFNSIPALFV